VPEPQSVIIPAPNEHSLFIILRVHQAGRHRAALGRALVQTPRLTKELAASSPNDHLISAVAIGPELWDVLSPNRRPAGFRQFKAQSAHAVTVPPLAAMFSFTSTPIAATLISNWACGLSAIFPKASK